MKILLAGAPGAGKGTQGSLLAQQLEVPHIASGDIVRDHIERATPEGERLVMVDGTGTIDEVAGRIVRELQVWRLRRPLAV